MRVRDTVAYGLRFARNAIDGASPRVLYLEVTKRCNAFCDFCPYWQTHDRGELTDYSPIVERMRPFCVTFTGGEPLLRRDIAELVGQVARLPARPWTALLTNGWLLSEEKAAAMRAAGLEQLCISVDYIGEEHDKQRGLPGLFARIERRIPSLLALGYRVVINTVIMESNLAHVAPLARLTHRWGVQSSFSCYSPLKTDGPGPSGREELLPPAHLDALRRTIDEVKFLKRRQGNVVSSDWYLDRAIEYFANGGHLGERCEAAGRRFYHVDPWGRMKICPEFEPFAHWTELDEKRPPEHHCTRCWYGCRGENEAPITLGRVARDLRIGDLLRGAMPPAATSAGGAA
jgi:MoaA/NifB/PqqE/SkfB family radical SAM enzyme